MINNRATEIFKGWLRDGLSDERVNESQRKRLTVVFSVVFGWAMAAVLVYGADMSFAGYDLGAIGRDDMAVVFFVGGLSSGGAAGFQALLNRVNGKSDTPSA